MIPGEIPDEQSDIESEEEEEEEEEEEDEEVVQGRDEEGEGGGDGDLGESDDGEEKPLEVLAGRVTVRTHRKKREKSKRKRKKKATEKEKQALLKREEVQYVSTWMYRIETSLFHLILLSFTPSPPPPLSLSLSLSLSPSFPLSQFSLPRPMHFVMLTRSTSVGQMCQTLWPPLSSSVSCTASLHT